MIENIALIEEVHQRTSRLQAHAHAMEKLRKLKLEPLATKRTSQCNEYEHFAIALIRASMMQYVTIVIITPLVQYSSKDPIEDLKQMIDSLEIDNPILVLDLKLYESEYEAKGFTCNTIG